MLPALLVWSAITAPAMPSARCHKLLLKAASRVGYTIEKVSLSRPADRQADLRENILAQVLNAFDGYAKVDSELGEKTSLYFTEYELWKNVIARFLADKEYSAQETPYGLLLDRERLAQVQGLVTRWVPPDYQILYQPFVLTVSQMVAALSSDYKFLVVPVWFPFYPRDFKFVLPVLHEAAHLHMHKYREQSGKKLFRNVIHMYGDLSRRMSPYFYSYRNRFTTEEIIAHLVTGAFALDCIGMTGKEETFEWGLKYLHTTQTMLDGYLDHLFPELLKHRNELATRQALSTGNGHPRLKFTNLQATIANLEVDSAFQFFPSLYVESLFLELHDEAIQLRALREILRHDPSRTSIGETRQKIWQWLERNGLPTAILRPYLEDCESFDLN